MYQLVEKMHNLNSYYISPAGEDAGNVWDTTEVGYYFALQLSSVLGIHVVSY